MSNRIEIEVPAGTRPSNWQRDALALAKREAELRKIVWRDADVFVALPERGRCYVKKPGFLSLGAHG